MQKFMRVAMVALLATMVGLTVAQSRQGGGGDAFNGVPGQLVNSKTVLADIKATDEQAAKLKEWAKEYQTKRATVSKDLKDLTKKEERVEKWAALSADAWKQIGEVLKPEQVKRLKQIELQNAGVVAYSRKDVTDALKITDDQKEKIRQSVQSMFKDAAALRDEFGLKGLAGAKLEADKQKDYDKKRTTLTKETAEKFEGVLTDDQKKKWKEMTGDPIDVQKVQAETRPTLGKKKD